MKNMNLPNKLTLLRVFMVPFFVVFLLLAKGDFEYFKWIAFALFVAASLTDLLDGKIARKYNLVTNFGKFMDPIADKLLVCAALVCLTEMGFVPSWMTIVIISREFIISGFRLVAAETGVVIAASMWGKWKTACTMVALCVMIVVVNPYSFANLSGLFQGLSVIANVLMWISVILTVVSLVDYLAKNKDVLKDM